MAVTFTPSELEQTLGQCGLGSAAVARFTMTASQPATRLYDPSQVTPALCPVLRFGGDALVIAPTLVVPATVYHLSCLAKEHKCEKAFAAQLREAVAESAFQSLASLGAVPLAAPRVARARGASILECLMQFDTDKALYVQVITDDLSGLQPDAPSHEWDTSHLASILAGCLTNALGILASLSHQPTGILVLLVPQGVGRPFSLSLPPEYEQTAIRLMALAAPDLETIAEIEHGDPMALWYYANAKQRIRSKIPVIAISDLDEFALYRACRHSYHLAEDAVPTEIVVAPGGSGTLRREVAAQMDRRALAAPSRDAPIEVVRASDHSGIVHVPADPSALECPAMAVNVGRSLIWILGDSDAAESDSPAGPLSVLLVDTLAYWLEQLAPHLDDALSSLEAVQPTVIRLHLANPAGWPDHPSTLSQHTNEGMTEALTHTVAVTGQWEIAIVLRPLFARVLSTADNSGERLLVRTVLDALVEVWSLAGWVVPSDRAADWKESLLGEVAPLGRKKKLILVSDSDPVLNGRGLPDCRTIHEFALAVVADDIAAFLHELGIKPGTLHGGSAHKLANQTVDFLFKQLSKEIAQFEGRSLLADLVGQHESLVNRMATIKLTIPTRLACYGLDSTDAKALADLMSKYERTGMACRFLIEVVAAVPPSGTRRPSIEAFDRLVALASEIIDLGTASDLIQFNLTAVVLDIPRSMRLRLQADTLALAGTAYRERLMPARLEAATAEFGRHWVVAEQIEAGTILDMSVPEPPMLEAAYEPEFHFTIDELGRVFGELGNIGDEQDVPLKRASATRLLNDLPSAAHARDSAVHAILDEFSLEPREDFFTLSSDFKLRDVYPWLFNRALSYLRRPLIALRSDEGTSYAWGNRHLSEALQWFYGNLRSGRYRARKQQMTAAVGAVRSKEAEEFRQSVQDLYKGARGLYVDGRVKKFGSKKIADIAGNDLGDIDVFVASESRKELLLIECKDTAAARNPYEYSIEMQDLVSDPKSTVLKHARRAQWVRDNLAVVAAAINIDCDSSWSVTPAIVTSSELMSPLLAESKIPILSIRSFVADILPPWVRI
jgi:hypothetical protein